MLTTLPEDVIEQVCAILHAVDDIPEPYRALKVQLVNLPLNTVKKNVTGQPTVNKKRR